MLAMKLNIEYDPKTNMSITRKLILGETNYYVGLTKICANCGRAIIGYPAISRKDNITEVCSDCGKLEAIEDAVEYHNLIKECKNNISNNIKSNI